MFKDTVSYFEILVSFFWLSLDARDENIAILEEAAAIQMCLLSDLGLEAGESADTESIAVKLTEKLLHMQEKQLALLVKSIQQGLVRGPAYTCH